MKNENPFINKLSQQFASYAKGKSQSDISQLMRCLFDQIQSISIDNTKPLNQINAPNAVVEVIDQQSGQLFRRYLTLGYFENDNGLRLSGESMDANARDIVFLSEAAINKMNELQGQGIDEPRCGEH